jgi:hypothetical protein
VDLALGGDQIYSGEAAFLEAGSELEKIAPCHFDTLLAEHLQNTTINISGHASGPLSLAQFHEDARKSLSLRTKENHCRESFEGSPNSRSVFDDCQLSAGVDARWSGQSPGGPIGTIISPREDFQA